MPRPANLIPTESLHIMIPQDVYVRLCLHLHSEVEDRIPHGAFQAFFVARIREFFSDEHLDLAPYTGATPGVFIISGTPEAISLVKDRL